MPSTITGEHSPQNKALTPAPSGPRALSVSQERAIQLAMQTFVTDDIAHGIGAQLRIYCDACERARPKPGAIPYDRYLLCNACAVEYEIAHARGTVTTPGQYVRDVRFGDGGLHALAE